MRKGADYDLPKIRVRRVGEVGRWIFRKGIYEIELSELGSSTISWTLRTETPTTILRPFYGLGDAWSVVNAADAADPLGAWVSFYDEDAQP
jgi:hypothetical protein